MSNITDINSSRESLRALISIFTDLHRLPKEYDGLLQPLFSEISKDDELSTAALTKCKQSFDDWDQDQEGPDEAVVKRCMNLWMTIKGEDYGLKKPLSNPSNLVVQEVDVNELVDENDLKRVEFDPRTGEPLKNSLGNLIIEEVEAADYIDSSDCDLNG